MSVVTLTDSPKAPRDVVLRPEAPAALRPGPDIGQALVAWRRLRAELVAAEGAGLRRLETGALLQELNYRSLGDLAREELKISARTARHHVQLVETLAAAPELERAFRAGRLGPCQVRTLRPLLAVGGAPAPAAGLDGWIRFAAGVTVRHLQRAVRHALAAESARDIRAAEAVAEAATDAEWRSVVLEAPLSARVAWEEGLERTRRVLGWQAPVGECLEAILAEVAAGAEAGAADPRDPAPREPADAGAVGSGAVAPNAVDSNAVDSNAVDSGAAAPDVAAPNAAPRAPAGFPGPPVDAPEGVVLPGPPLPPAWCNSRTLRPALDRFHAALERARESAAFGADSRPGPESAREILGRLTALRTAHRPLRLALGELLGTLRATAAHPGEVGPLDAFLERHLHLAPRTARALVAEFRAFEDAPTLARAYVEGRIGVTQAMSLKRLAGGVRSGGGAVPGDPGDGGRPGRPPEVDPGPWIDRAGRLTGRQFEREVRFLEQLRAALPEFRALTVLPGALTGIREALHRRGRELGLVVDDLVADGGPHHDPAEDPDALDPLEDLLHRVICGQEEVERQMFSRVRARHRIRFRAPEDLVRRWSRACAAWPHLPPWAAGLLLMRAAITAWQDEARRAVVRQRRVLERDGYRCRVPGCGARRGLEVHHIVYRAAGGTDAHDNLVTLCHFHHHHGIHRGRMRVTRDTRGILHWRTPLANWTGELRQ